MTDPFPDVMTIGDRYHPAMKITDQDEADEYFERCVEWNMRVGGHSREEAERIERSNLGYFAGYYDHETRIRVEQLFRCTHPVFGEATTGPPTATEAVMAGMKKALEE